MLRHLDGPDKESLTVKQAAKWLGIPLRTLNAWIEAGRVPAPVRLNERVFVYSWRVVVAIGELIHCGHLRADAPENPPAQARRSGTQARRSEQLPDG